MVLTTLDVGCGALTIYLLHRMLNNHKSRLPLPPGPRGLPVVGNMLDMPSGQEWKTFAHWGETHGDIMSVTILGQTIVILNSSQHALTLLDQRSAIYSDRPKLMMGGEIVGWRKTLALTPYGSRFRATRKLIHSLMGSRAQLAAGDEVLPLIELESHRFLRRVLEDPASVADSIRKTAGAIILRLSHGYQVKENADPIVACVDHATDQFSAVSQPGAWLVDVLSILRYVPAWMPGAGFQRKAVEWRHTLQQMVDIPHNFVKEQIAVGTAEPSFTASNLESKSLSADEEDTLKWAAASLYAGGADTTVSAVYSFYLAMTHFPEVQKAAQAEIDAVVGSDRLPSLNDRERLPYVEALSKEVLRWQPVTPMGIPHRTTEEDTYEGYRIPAGAIVLTNIWRMLHDENVYVDPFTFKPTRFLSDTPEPDPHGVAFGFGRRICPGQHLADASVWLQCAMTLAAFDVCAVPGEKLPEPAMTDGTISHPVPFRCHIRPRSEQARELVLSVNFADDL